MREEKDPEKEAWPAPETAPSRARAFAGYIYRLNTKSVSPLH